MKRFGIALVLAMYVTLVNAANYLEPEESKFAEPWLNEFDRYDAMVLSALKEMFETDIQARVIALPSFQPEYAVGVREKGPRYTILLLRPAVQLWTYETIESLKRGVGNDQEIARLQAQVPPDYRNVKIERCEVEIAPALALRIVRLWKAMLLQTRYSETPSVGLDGATYHFSMNTTDNPNRVRQILAGQTWTPSLSSDPGRFVAATDSMREYCNTKNPRALREVEQQVDALLARQSR